MACLLLSYVRTRRRMEPRSGPARSLPLRWRMAAAPLVCIFVAVVGVAIVGERLAAYVVREHAQQRLLSARDRAVVALQDHADETRANLAALAADPRTVMAFKRLRRATDELDTAPSRTPPPGGSKQGVGP